MSILVWQPAAPNIRDSAGELDKLLLQKIADPALEINAHPVLTAIINLIATEQSAA